MGSCEFSYNLHMHIHLKKFLANAQTFAQNCYTLVVRLRNRIMYRIVSGTLAYDLQRLHPVFWQSHFSIQHSFADFMNVHFIPSSECKSICDELRLFLLQIRRHSFSSNKSYEFTCIQHSGVQNVATTLNFHKMTERRLCNV